MIQWEFPIWLQVPRPLLKTVCTSSNSHQTLLYDFKKKFASMRNEGNYAIIGAILGGIIFWHCSFSMLWPWVHFPNFLAPGSDGYGSIRLSNSAEVGINPSGIVVWQLAHCSHNIFLKDDWLYSISASFSPSSFGDWASLLLAYSCSLYSHTLLVKKFFLMFVFDDAFTSSKCCWNPFDLHKCIPDVTLHAVLF